MAQLFSDKLRLNCSIVKVWMRTSGVEDKESYEINMRQSRSCMLNNKLTALPWKYQLEVVVTI